MVSHPRFIGRMLGHFFFLSWARLILGLSNKHAKFNNRYWMIEKDRYERCLLLVLCAKACWAPFIITIYLQQTTNLQHRLHCKQTSHSQSLEEENQDVSGWVNCWGRLWAPNKMWHFNIRSKENTVSNPRQIGLLLTRESSFAPIKGHESIFNCKHNYMEKLFSMLLWWVFKKT